jgi:hypothetical protein
MQSERVVLGEQDFVSKKGGFFYCPDEVIDHRDRGQIMLECGQIIRKVTDQRRSALRTGPSGSDKGVYVNFPGLDLVGVAVIGPH